MENELTSVTVNGQTTSFSYDASGMRVKTVRPNGTIIDTPFPDYEVENPNQPAQTIRITLSIAGQAAAQRVITTGTSTYYYLFTDHLGSLAAMQASDGSLVVGSRAYYLPFGDYRGTPPSQTLTDRGFTGQKSNNQPNADLGLLYYNARYYLPSIAKFASADTIVPDPANPQQFNRYAYALNNPVRFVDPAGHCAGFGDDACWTLYDRIVNICPECAEYGLEQYGSPYLQDYLDNLNSGWRPYIHCSGRDGCHVLILTWLDMLTQSGELGRQLAAYFKQHGITVRFTDADFVMRLNYDMTIEIGNARVDNKLNLHGTNAHLLLFAQFGHEITHHQQGYINGVSIQGEYLAYKNQIELARGYSQQATVLAFDALNVTASEWDTLYVNLDPSSYIDMKFFYDNFLSPFPNDPYKYTPIFPWPKELLHWFLQGLSHSPISPILLP